MDMPFPKDFPAHIKEGVANFLQRQEVGVVKFEQNKSGKSDEDMGVADVDFGKMDTANVVTSKQNSGIYGSGSPYHRPIVDIDFPVYTVPSTTPGHNHLYIDRPLTWKQYHFLLWAFKMVGIIEDGYFKASVKRGYTVARLPWVKKEKPKFQPMAIGECDCPLCVDSRKGDRK